MRISAYGIQFIKSPDAFPGKNTLHVSNFWNTMRCVPTHDAFCRVQDASEMLLFPTTTVDIPDDWSNIKSNSYIRSFPADSACHGNTGRSILVNDTRYEISLCDLLDSNIDFVWHNDGSLWWRQNRITTIEIVLIVIFSLYCINCVANNIVHMIHRNSLSSEESNHVLSRTQFVLFLGAFLYIILVLFLELQHITFEHEMFLANILVIFVVLEGIVLYSKFKNAHGISVITSLLFLLSFRVYLSFDNPYSIILAILFATRSNYKFLACTNRLINLQNATETAKSSWFQRAQELPWIQIVLVVVDVLVLTLIVNIIVSAVSLQEFESALQQGFVLILGMKLGAISRVLTFSSNTESSK